MEKECLHCSYRLNHAPWCPRRLDKIPESKKPTPVKTNKWKRGEREELLFIGLMGLVFIVLAVCLVISVWKGWD